MRQPFLFLIIILAFTSFAYLSIQQISNLHQSLSAKPDTVFVKPNINDDFSYKLEYKTLNKSKGLDFEYLMDSLYIISDDTTKSLKKDIDKVFYNIYDFSSEDSDERFQTYIGTKETNFAAKVKYNIRTFGSSYSSDNYVITALIYLKNGDIKIPFPHNF